MSRINLQKTLNPVFDECFEFGTITLEQCTQESAMIAFTVMDHDVITANDFAGEAFLSLNNIPGVAESILGVDNFHGLKPIDLILMQQRDKCKKTSPEINFNFIQKLFSLDHPIFQILESRTFDKPALDFVRKQKARVS